MELTILMPCLNEAETLATCIRKAKSFLEEHQVDGEVLISDNGSTDGSPDIAEAEGARVVHAPIRGYGGALIEGCKAARGTYVIMGDADDSYDFTNLMPFVEKLREGYDLVMGDRFAGGIEDGAMPWSHRYIGNPVLSFVGRMFFHSRIRDFHCGLRGYNREAILALDLQTSGMEYASEMVVKAELHHLKIAEVPTTLRKDGRSRPPHLRSLRDGWRHLKFLLMYSPNWLFLYPGLILLAIGLVGSLALVLEGSLNLFHRTFSSATLLYFIFFVILGFNIITMFWIVKLYAYNHNFLPKGEADWNKRIREDLLIFGGMAAVVLGIILSISALGIWRATGYGDLNPEMIMRRTIPAAALIALGVQSVFAGFVMSIIKVKAASSAKKEPASGGDGSEEK